MSDNIEKVCKRLGNPRTEEERQFRIGLAIILDELDSLRASVRGKRRRRRGGRSSSVSARLGAGTEPKTRSGMRDRDGLMGGSDEGERT